MLATSTGGAEGINPQIRLVDFNRFRFICFRHNGNGARRRMNPPLRLGFRHALDAVSARFKLERAINLSSGDQRDDFLVSAVFALIFTQDFYSPATRLGIAAVHAKQIPCEKCGFITARACPDFQKSVLAVIGILRHHQSLQFIIQPLLTLGSGVSLVLRHRPHIGVAISRKLFSFGDIVTGFQVVAITQHYRFDLCKFT